MTVLTPPGYVQGGTYTAKLDRIYLATLGNIANLGATFSARQGFFSGRVPVYANPSGMNITMGACGAIIANTFASASGDYLMANDASVQVTLAAASPTLNRYDIIGFQVKDNLFDSSGLNTAVPAVIQGANSAGTPSDPALPSSFIPVLRAVVNATNTSPAALQSLIRKTASDGGLLRVANLAERAEITPYQGLMIYREDKLWTEIHDGTAWRVQGNPSVTNLADITDPLSGQRAYHATNRDLYVYDGTAWVPFQQRAGRLVTQAGTLGTTSGTAELNYPKLALTGLRLRQNAWYVLTYRLDGNSLNASEQFLLQVRHTTALSGTIVTDMRWNVPNQPSVTDTKCYTVVFQWTAADTNTGSLHLSAKRNLGTGTLDIFGDSRSSVVLEERGSDAATWSAVV